MKKIDKKILFSVVILNVIGIFTFLSASLTYLKTPDNFTKLFLFQMGAIVLGFFAIYIIQKNKYINYLSIKNNSVYFFIASMILQLAVLIPFIGKNINGAQRWLDIGVMTIQPSEIFRFFSILFIANIFFILSEKMTDFKFFIKTFLPFGIAIVLFYVFTKDLGSLIILFASILAMLIFTKINKFKLSILVVSTISILLLIAWFFIPHAQERLAVSFGLNKDKQGSFYQINNMLEAVGSGMISGVGYGESIQKFNGYIPEAISDSIFSIYAEEWGFLGSIILVAIYLFLSLSIFLQLSNIKNLYQKYVVVGLSVNLLFPAFYNIAAVLAIVPLSGMPLTFISKGGTSIFISLVSIGIILLFLQKK